jgi:hypothetical protein
MMNHVTHYLLTALALFAVIETAAAEGFIWKSGIPADVQ